MSKVKNAFMFILSTCSDAELQELLKESSFSGGAIFCIREEIENRRTAKAIKEGDAFVCET